MWFKYYLQKCGGAFIGNVNFKLNNKTVWQTAAVANSTYRNKLVNINSR